MSQFEGANLLDRTEMSHNLRGSLQRAMTYAFEQSHRQVTLEHLLLALADDREAAVILESSAINVSALMTDVSGYLGRLDDRVKSGQPQQPELGDDVQHIIHSAGAAAQKSKRRAVSSALVLAAIVGDGRSPSAQMLRNHGLTFENAIAALKQANTTAAANPVVPPAAVQPAPPQPSPAPPASQPQPSSAEPATPSSARPDPALSAPTPGSALAASTAAATNAGAARLQNMQAAHEIIASARERIAAARGTVATRKPEPDLAASPANQAPTTPAPLAQQVSNTVVPPPSAERPVYRDQPTPAETLQPPPGARLASPQSPSVATRPPPPEPAKPVDLAPAGSEPPKPPQPATAQRQPTPADLVAPNQQAPTEARAPAAAREPAPERPAPPAPVQTQTPQSSNQPSLRVPPSLAPPPSFDPVPRPSRAAPRAPLSPPPAPQFERSADRTLPPTSAGSTRPTPTPAPTAFSLQPGSSPAAPPPSSREPAAANPPGANARPVPVQPAPPHLPGQPTGAPPTKPEHLPMPQRQPENDPLPRAQHLTYAQQPVQRPADPANGLPGGVPQYAHPAPPPPTAYAPPPQAPVTYAGQPAPDVSPIEPEVLAEDIPAKMCVGVPQTVEIRAPRARLEAWSGGNTDPRARDAQIITKAMVMRLRAPEGGFTIETASPETQWSEGYMGPLSDDVVSWRWIVTPLDRGRLPLQLSVSTRIVGRDGLAAARALPEQLVTVRVSSNYSRLGIRLAVAVGLVVTGLVLGYFGDGLFGLGSSILAQR